MLIQYTDFNGADAVINGGCKAQWKELSSVLENMPLHLKASDQAKKQGNPIFDAVGTNRYIAEQLIGLGWGAKIPIGGDLAILGTDIDFGKKGMIVEVQFSNYPFLLNNTLRSELFFRAKTVFHHAPTCVAVIVTKAGMFPASNSTLYYEQAVSQLAALAKHNVFTVPIRLVGLFENVGAVKAHWTGYSAARYSRTVSAQDLRDFTITKGGKGRCRVDPDVSEDDV